MELVLTSIVAPTVIGVLLMLIEYWVIIPAKEQNNSKVSRKRATPFLPSIALVSIGALAFVFAIVVMLTQIISLNYFSVPDNIPYASSISFATVIFVCSALNYVTYYYNGSNASRFFTARVLPPALALLWGMSFLQGQGWPFFFVLVLVNIWVLSPTYVNGYRTPLQIIVLAAMLPINALSFVITVTPTSEFLGWLIAGIILLCSLAFLGSEPPQTITQDNNDVANNDSA